MIALHLSLAIWMILTPPLTARAQRCGDDIWLYVIDEKGKVISPEVFDSVEVGTGADTAEKLDVKDDRNLKEVPKGIRSISIRSGCGLPSVTINVTDKGQRMTLRLLHVPGDAGNILLEAVPFRKGSYEIDLEGRKLNNCVNDPSIEEPADERGGPPMCIIKAVKWKESVASK